MSALLDPPDYFDGFSWALPNAFADALALCRFEQGDMLYDTRRAYEGEWRYNRKLWLRKGSQVNLTGY